MVGVPGTLVITHPYWHFPTTRPVGFVSPRIHPSSSPASNTGTSLKALSPRFKRVHIHLVSLPLPASSPWPRPRLRFHLVRGTVQYPVAIRYTYVASDPLGLRPVSPSSKDNAADSHILFCRVAKFVHHRSGVSLGARAGGSQALVWVVLPVRGTSGLCRYRFSYAPGLVRSGFRSGPAISHNNLRGAPVTLNTHFNNFHNFTLHAIACRSCSKCTMWLYRACTPLPVGHASNIH